MARKRALAEHADAGVPTCRSGVRGICLVIEVIVRVLLITREFFFFSSRRRHTRLQGDWSSDVCSSDLILALFVPPALQSSTIGIPTDGQMTLLVGALALILAINAAASVVLVAARLPGIRERPWAGTVRDRMFPPMVPIVATVLEYLHGVDLSLVFPDGQVYYVVTGRDNATKVDWYDILATTPAMTAEATQALQEAPPRWIFVQEYNESDINHAERLDFESQPAWKPIFDFITANYELVGSEDGVDAYRLK